MTKLCANGDGRPICPPSKVICRECMDKIRQFLCDELARAKRNYGVVRAIADEKDHPS